MKKIISFSLWGDNPKYTIGAIKNLDLAKKIYPDWICRFYCASSVPEDILKQISLRDNQEIVRFEHPGNFESSFWRFYAAEDADIAIFRDTDSRVSLREKCAVEEWIKSDKSFHIMKDHPGHKYEIMAGMWGVKSPALINIRILIDNFTIRNYYTVDQEFLRQVVYEIAIKDVLFHDEFFIKNNFPPKRKNFAYVGEVFDENDVTSYDYVEPLKKYLG